MKMKKSNVLVICFLVISCMLLTACGNRDYGILEGFFEKISGIISEKEESTETYQVDTGSHEEKLDVGTKNAETRSIIDEAYIQFNVKAEEIEAYSRENLETASTQAELNLESHNVFVMWDNLLNEVYQYLKAHMNADDFADLKADEIQWIKEKERAMDNAEKEWQGGSGAAMARNCAGIEYTSSRCYYLISLVLECQ